MAIAKVGASSVSSISGAGSLTATLPQAATANNVLTVFVTATYGSTGSATCSTPVGWTLDDTQASGGSSQSSIWVFHKVAAGGDSAPVFAIGGAVAGTSFAVAEEWSGVDTATPVRGDGTNASTTTSGSITLTDSISAQSGDVILSGATSRPASACTYMWGGGSATDTFVNQTGNTAIVGTGSQTVATSGTITPSVTLSAARGGAMVSIALKLAGSGGAPQSVSPSGIGTSEAFGTAAATPGAVTVDPSGIVSAEAFGTPVVTTVGQGTGTALADWGGLEVAASGGTVVIDGTALADWGGLQVAAGTGVVSALCDWGGVDAAVDTTSKAQTGVVLCDWGGIDANSSGSPHKHGLPPPPALPMLRLYDTDGVTWLANLTEAENVQAQQQIGAPGVIQFKIPVDQAGEVVGKRIVKAVYRGRTVQSARVDGYSTDYAVDGLKWRSYTLPGLLAITADIATYPEYELGRKGGTSRSFGYMSRTGDWLAFGNWTPGEGVPWSQETDIKKGRGFRFDLVGDPWWIAKRGDSYIEPGGALQYFRRQFTLAERTYYQIICTADDELTLWLDGQQIFAPSQQGNTSWHSAYTLSGTLEPGAHVLAAEVANWVATYTNNPMALILTMRKADATTGDPVKGTPLIITDPHWSVSDIYPGARRADVLRTILDEGRARGVRAAQILSTGFSRDVDSAGKAWPDAPGEYAVDIGSTLSDAVTRFAQTGPDVVIDPDRLTLQAFGRLGADISADVTLELGVSLTGHAVAVTEAGANTALMQLADGTWIEQQDGTALGLYGRAEVGVSLGSTADTASAAQVAAAQFSETAHGSKSFTTTHSAFAGPQPWRDYELGDTIAVSDGSGGVYKARVMALTIEGNGETPTITPELVLDRS